MKKIIVLAFMCSLSFAAAGQDVAAGQPTVTLQDCISRGLENNFSIRMVKNRQQVSDNNASPANAGLLPTVDLSASYGGDFHTSRSTSRSTGITSTEKNAYDGTLDVGVDLNWTVFDGFSVWTNYKQLKLMKEQGELETRLAVEDYVASVITEYYNFIQQKIRLENFRKNMELSRERFRNVGISYSIGSYSLVDYLQAKVYFNADSTQYMKQLEALMGSLDSFKAGIEEEQNLVQEKNRISISIHSCYSQRFVTYICRELAHTRIVHSILRTIDNVTAYPELPQHIESQSFPSKSIVQTASEGRFTITHS